MAAQADRSTRRAKRAALPATQPKVADVKRTESASGFKKTADKEGKGRKKVKGVRDTFTMPEPEYELIRALKKRCLGLGVAVKKSEVLRAGVAVLAALSDDRLTQAVTSVAGSGRLPGNKNGR